VGLHVTLAVVVPVFILLCLWQVRRATSGNELSWAYVFEWPFFATYAIYLWWRLVHDQPLRAAAASDDHAIAAGPAPPASGATVATGGCEPAVEEESEDEELAAYNRYLADLDAGGQPKRW
jgi:hypothetical protein